MSKHTPAFWHACAADGGHLVVGYDGKAICGIPENFGRSHEERQANTELIAKAPDLLEDLSAIVEINRRFVDFSMGKATIYPTVDEFCNVLEDAETLLALLAESGVTPGEVA